MSGHEGARRIWIVAVREIRERARTRAFQLSTVVSVLAVVALVVLPSMLSPGPTTYHVGLAGTVATGTADALTAQAKTADARVITTSYATTTAAEQALRDQAVDVLLVDGTTLEWRQRPDAALATLVGSAARAVRRQCTGRPARALRRRHRRAPRAGGADGATADGEQRAG